MILVNLLLMTVIWVACSFNFYMISFKVKYFPGSLNLNQFGSFTAECLGYIAGGFLLARFRSKAIFAGLFTLSAIAGVLIIMVGQNTGGFFVIFVLLAKFGVSAAFALVYVVHPKMFPTLFSVTSMGIVNIVSRFLTIFAPMVAEIKYPVPMVTFTLLCIASVLSSCFLRETTNAK